MLDATTKRKIDSARNILVGKVPDPKAQVEQVTTALVYKFMDDMDKEAQELGGNARFFTNGFEKFAWSNLLDPKLSGQGRLDLYVEAITHMSQNPHIPQLFRDIFKDSYLPYRDPQTLSLFLKEINDFTYDHSEKLGDAFEYLLSVLGSQGDAGQFRTPRHIIDFMVDVVGPKKDETILDPACGTAGFLISAYKHIIAQHDGKDDPNYKELPLTPDEKKRLMNNVVGYDISPDMVRLSLVNMYLHGFPTPNISEYDTLTDEEKWDDSFDVILANPPFMTPTGGIRPHRRFSIQANRSEVLFVDYIAEHLSPKGRGAVIVPEGVIFQTGNAYKALRKMLVENYLYAVVSLPAGVFNPYSGVKTSILFFDKMIAKQSEDIMFIKISHDGFDLGAQRRVHNKNDLPDAALLLKSYAQNKNLDTTNYKLSDNSILVDKNVLKENDYILSFDRFVSAGDEVDSEHEIVDLKDVAYFQEGPGILSSQYADQGYPIVNVGNVRDGYVDVTKTKYVTSEMAEGKWSHFQINEGDILFTTSGTIGRSAIVKKENLPLLLNTSVVRFRPLDKEVLDAGYLFWILRSNRLVDRLLSMKTGSAQFNVGPSHIKQLKIPLPPLEIQKQIVEELSGYQKIIDGAKQVLSGFEIYISEEKDWQQKPLSELTDRITKGTTPTTSGHAFVESGINYVKIESISDDGRILERKLAHITQECNTELSRSQLQENDVLFSIAGAFGRVAVVKPNLLPANTNQALAIIRLKTDKILPEFLFWVLKSQRIRKEVERLKVGVAQFNISLQQVGELLIPVPPLEIQESIVKNLNSKRSILIGLEEIVTDEEQKIEDKIAEVWGE